MPRSDIYTQTLEKKLREWLKLDENQDRRGTRAEANKKARKGRRQFERAREYEKEHPDPTTRREARKVVKGVLHDPFPKILTRLSRLRGLVNKAGKRSREAAEREADERRQASERTIELDDRHALRELRSVKSLQQVGRALGNCVAKKKEAQGYLRDREMWVLVDRERQRPLCLIAVNVEDREISECEGPGGSTPKLKRSLAFKILTELDVSGDDEEAFTQIGAFHAFRHGRLKVEPVETGGRLHWIWRLDHGAEIIIATRCRPGERRRWSRFTRQEDEIGGGWHWHELSLGELFALMQDHPALAKEVLGTTE